MYYSDNKGYCTIYSINYKNFTEIECYNSKCSIKHYCLSLNYFKETNQFIFSCFNDNSKIEVIFFDDDFKESNRTDISIDSTYDLKSVSIVYSMIKNTFFFISDMKYSNGSNILIQYISFNYPTTASTTTTETTNSATATTETTNSATTKTETTNSVTTTTETTNSATTTTQTTNSPTTTTQTIESRSVINSKIIELKTNVTKENLIENLPSIINEIEIGKIYQKVTDDFSIFIYPTNSNELTSTTHVNFKNVKMFYDAIIIFQIQLL